FFSFFDSAIRGIKSQEEQTSDWAPRPQPTSPPTHRVGTAPQALTNSSCCRDGVNGRWLGG
ncbi:hypothetical protein M406DRAFT_354474, partial [Cryphonectria parasitica EP155]